MSSMLWRNTIGLVWSGNQQVDDRGEECFGEMTENEIGEVKKLDMRGSSYITKKCGLGE